ncbi:MAG: carbonic anhydrase [Pseudomonadales bacterium]|nr:carbonic anhydrase [Pseudomonadales bacterium]
MKKVISGTLKFRSAPFQERKKLFDELANGQSPEVMFVTSADSRIDPNLVTQSEPGDLFIVRNAGNIVPAHTGVPDGIAASIEFGVAALGVKHIVVCGHTDCGAMKGAINPGVFRDMPHTQDWLENSRAAIETVRAKYGKATMQELDKIIEENVLLQLQHLKSYPALAAGLATGSLDLHGWVYDIEHGTVRAFDEATGEFVDIAERYADIVAGSSEAA